MPGPESFPEHTPYGENVEALFDVADMMCDFGEDYVLQILEDLAQTGPAKDHEQ